VDQSQLLVVAIRPKAGVEDYCFMPFRKGLNGAAREHGDRFRPV
jgi:hypothetical protein